MRPQFPAAGTERSERAGMLEAERAGTIIEARQAAPRSAVARRFGDAEQVSPATLSARAVLDLLRRPEPCPGAIGDVAVADGIPGTVTSSAPSTSRTHAAAGVLADEAERAAPRRLTVPQLALLGLALYFAALAAVDAHHRYREWQVITVPAPLDGHTAIA